MRNLWAIFILVLFVSSNVFASEAGEYCSNVYIDSGIELYLSNKKIDALAVLIKSEDCNNLDVNYIIGNIYLDPSLDIYSPKKSFDYISEASELGHVESTRLLAWQYKLGVGTAINEDMFCVKLTEAAAQGSARASEDLYGVVLSGFCDSVEMQKVISFLVQSESEDYPPALLKLGASFVEGFGIEKDVTRGVAYIERSAKGGYMLAQLYLYALYSDGEVVTKDCTKARYWHSMALSNIEDNIPEEYIKFHCD